MREINPTDGPIGGIIAQISSIGGWTTAAGKPFYHASKFALEGFTETVAKELDPAWNIRFVIFEPGAVKTKWAAENMEFGGFQHEAYRGKNLAVDRNKQLGPQISDKLAADAGKVADLMAAVIMDENGKWGGQSLLRLPVGADAWALQNKDVDEAKANLTKWKVVSDSTSPDSAHETLKAIGLI